MYINTVSYTPIQKINEKINDNTFYIKRDDLIPLSFGGNKARKAILFFEDLKKNDFNCVVTYGSISSNHCRIIANMAVMIGIPCFIISPDSGGRPGTNSKMLRLFGAKVTRCPVSQVSAVIKEKMKCLSEKGYKPYFIEGGGHGNIGTQAYVNAYEEIIDFENKSGLHFDYIFHATGTGTTQAGLVCGNIIHGNKKTIVGISIARKNPYGSKVVIDSVNKYLRSIDYSYVATEPVYFIDDYVLDGYGSYNNEIIDIIKDVLVREGIPLDATYTGKGFWGMKEYIKKNNITEKNILFIHTGGTPLFFDNLGVVKND